MDQNLKIAGARFFEPLKLDDQERTFFGAPDYQIELLAPAFQLIRIRKLKTSRISAKPVYSSLANLVYFEEEDECQKSSNQQSVPGKSSAGKR